MTTIEYVKVGTKDIKEVIRLLESDESKKAIVNFIKSKIYNPHFVEDN